MRLQLSTKRIDSIRLPDVVHRVFTLKVAKRILRDSIPLPDLMHRVFTPKVLSCTGYIHSQSNTSYMHDLNVAGAYHHIAHALTL